MAIGSYLDVKLPAPIDEAPSKQPWRPRVSGVVGFLLGPLAAAIVSFINLRRLGSPRKASWVLIATVVACPLFGVATYYLQEQSEALSRLIGNLISPFLYPVLQRREFQEWEAQGQERPPANGWSAAGWGIVGIVLFLPLTMVGFLPYLLSEQVRDIDVEVTREIPFRLEQAAELKVGITNTGGASQLLKSLDIDRSLLREFELTSTDPPYEKTEAPPFTDVRTYYYNLELPPGEEVVIAVLLTPNSTGKFESSLAVCIDTDTNCLYISLNIPVEGTE